MTTALLRRIVSLEGVTTIEARPRLIVFCRAGAGEPIGLQAVGDRLPADLQRLPGEAWEGFLNRAEGLATGAGPFVAFAQYTG